MSHRYERSTAGETTASGLLRLVPPRLATTWCYLAAIVAVALAVLAQYEVLPPPSVAPFLFCFLAVVVSSWLGGRGPGLLATVVSALVANYLFAPPLHVLTLSGQLGRATAVFLPTGCLIALLGGSLREAMLEARGALAAQRKVSAALRASEERLRLAQSASGLGIYDHDLRTGAIAWDDRLREIWGVSRTAPVTWDRIMAAIHPDDREIVNAALERAHLQNADYCFEYRFTNARDRRERWVRVTGHATVEDGTPVRHVGTVEDISERRRDAEALKAANAVLAEADRRKDEFLGVLSHELRNPLWAIRNSLCLLERETPDGAQVDRARTVVERQTGHLCNLVDDLLDVTRVAHGKIRLERIRLDLVRLVRSVFDDHRASLEAEHRVLLDLPADAIWIDGDPTRLAQVVGNLLTNAAKFTPAGGTIRLSLEHRGGRAVLEVVDSGIGIDPDTLAMLFRPFTQADRSLDRSRGGLGLGLALVRGIVELHGGEVGAHSSGIGKGARFDLWLPIATGGEQRRESAPS